VITADDVGGVHIKYLYHCRRQLWLYARGMRPEALSSLVAIGEAVHDTSYARDSPVDLGAARIDFIDAQIWVHEVKSSARPTEADTAQAVHYCHRLQALGMPAQGAVLHYPATRRTIRIPYDDDQAHRAENDIADVLSVVDQPESPPRLPRTRCRGCSYFDYCWTDQPDDA
jgi:CRISPR-associated exonuclease Cas4